MNRKILFAIPAFPAALWAQGQADDFTYPISSTSMLTGGRFFFGLVCGILLAFAFQWVLTSLSLATGITSIGRIDKRSGSKPSDSDEGWESTAMKVGSGFGFWTLVTTAISTFFACWLTIYLFRGFSRMEAIVLSLAIWSGFMFISMALEAAALGTLFGAVAGVFRSALSALGAPLAAMAGGMASTASGKAIDSAQDIAAKVREELQGDGGMVEKLRGYLGKLSPGRNRDDIERESEELLDDPEIRRAAERGELQRTDRNRFRDMLLSRGDISAEEAGQWADALSRRWNRLRTEMGARRRTADMRATASAAGTSTTSIEEEQSIPGVESRGATQQAASYARQPSNTYAETTTVQRYAEGGFEERMADFEHFLSTADRRDLNAARLDQEMESLFGEYGNDYQDASQRARTLKRDDTVRILRQRRDLSAQEAEAIANLVDSARAHMLSSLESREHRLQAGNDRMLQRLLDRIYSLPKPQRDFEAFGNDISRLVESVKSGSIKEKGTDRESLIHLFSAAPGVSRQDAEKMADQTEKALGKASEMQEKISAETRRRLNEAQRKALEQAEATRRTAAVAAWWVFGIALITGIAAALGGWVGFRV